MKGFSFLFEDVVWEKLFAFFWARIQVFVTREMNVLRRFAC